MNLEFSIVIPIFNEKENIELLIVEIINKINKNIKFEIIIIDDGSTDGSKEVCYNLTKKYKNTYVFLHQENLGQSKAIHTGIINSSFNCIITLDGDGQNNPIDINNLINEFTINELDLIGGLRLNRKDSLWKIISSKIANKIRKTILQDDCLDTGCSLKIFFKKRYLEIPFFDGNHRFLPALFKGFGFKTKFIPVDHRKRIKGYSKYGTIDRMIKGIKDILVVKKIISNK